MKRISGILAMGVVMLMAYPAFAARAGEKGADAQAIEHASDQAIFHRVGDWFATVGKNPAKKQIILEERRTEREARRVEHETRHATQQAAREARGAAGRSHGGGPKR